MFYDILERKNAFLGYKNKKFKNSKYWHFPKGVNPWFWCKNRHFSNFFLGNIGKEKVFYEILEQKKNAFLGYKNKKLKKSKNWPFSKEVYPWFLVQKWPFFQLFLLGNIGQKNVFYDILQRKHAFLDYNNKKFKRSKNLRFSKGVKSCFWAKNGLFSIFF